jgi:GH25 family lysozyme M1 (1,4-beta-N-acetylmuramidase)
LTDVVKNNYKIWCARYPKNDNGTIKNNLSVKGLKNIVAWQYSSKGKVPGIVGNVDMDVDFGFMKRKTNLEVAKEVLEGKWGTAHTNPTRKSRLTAAGYDYREIQNLVNILLKNK